VAVAVAGELAKDEVIFVKEDKGKMNKLINKLADEPFKHGKNDCFTFTNALVKEWHGHDFRHLHPYKNKKEALEYIAKNGGIEALIIGTLGYSTRTSLLRDGDVGLVDTPDGPALGFIYDDHILVKYKKTVLKVPLANGLKGWTI